MENSKNYSDKTLIVDFYKNKTIFITGGTGFVGTVLIEKLLYSCGEVKKIYVLTKSGDTRVEEKIYKWLASSAFDRLKKVNPDVLKKVIPILGNMLEDNLGLSDVDKQTIQKEVNIVFHAAADTRFNLTLSDAVVVNTKPSQEIIKLAKGIQNLEAFVYVSTTYCNSNKKILLEKVLKSGIPLDTVFYIMENSKNDELLKHLLDGRPNTYTFSKALAEELFANEVDKMPITIVRPSVSAALQEPCPGWLKGWSGVNFVIIFIAKNISRCWKGNKNIIYDLVPVDMCVNLILASAWDTAKEWKNHKEEVKVFNYASGVRNPVSFGEIITTCKQHFARKSLIPCLPPLVVGNKFLHAIFFFIFQTIPDLFLSLIYWMSGGKLGFIKKLKPSERILGMYDYVEFFCEEDFIFVDNNVKDLFNKMHAKDKEIFDFEIEKIHWNSYLKLYTEGMEKYVLLEA